MSRTMKPVAREDLLPLLTTNENKSRMMKPVARDAALWVL
jgi:hypothetical protein